jgi:large subunit ribosomal protein L9
MLIILRQDIEKVGKAGEIVKVKDGFARNYLIPNNFAFPATDAFMNRYKEGTKSKGYKEAQIKKSEIFLKKALEEKTVVIRMKVGEEDKLFGSVTSQNIADELKKSGIELDKRKIHLEENIKHLGDFKIPYKSHSGLDIQISVKVAPEE